MSVNVFEALLLPYEAKEDLCRSLLAEFGAERVRKQGDELLHRCVMPWHDDRHPSARLNVEKLTYKCWSCASGGGLLWLISTVRGGNRGQALDWVSSTTGLDGEDLDAFMGLLEAISEDEGVRKVHAPMPSFSRRVLEPWAMIHPWLTDPRSEGGRGIPEENVERLEIGFAEHYPMDDKGTTSERIVIPHFWGDKLVGWQSRRLWDDGTPKYLSTEDMPKDSTLYAPPQGDTVVLVESPMSVARHIHHLPISATFGADVTDHQVRLLRDRYERVVLFPDNDPAGWKWMLGHTPEGQDYVPSLAERMEHQGMDVDVVESEWDVDPADMDDETVGELVQDAVPAMLWERPEALRCWECKAVHTGLCREEG